MHPQSSEGIQLLVVTGEPEHEKLSIGCGQGALVASLQRQSGSPGSLLLGEPGTSTANPASLTKIGATASNSQSSRAVSSRGDHTCDCCWTWTGSDQGLPMYQLEEHCGGGVNRALCASQRPELIGSAGPSVLHTTNGRGVMSQVQQPEKH